MNTCLFYLAFALVQAFSVQLQEGDSQQPSYNGRTLESWASDLNQGHLSLHMWMDQPTDSFNAFRNIGAAAVPLLAKKLEDKDRMVRHNSAEALKLMGIEARAALPALIKALDDDDAEVRGLACDALGAMGIEAHSAIPKLQKLLADKRFTSYPPHAFWYLRDRARDALVAIHVDALPEFIKAVKSPSIEVRITSIRALSEFPEESQIVVPLLIGLLEDPEPIVRALAASSLSQFGPLAKSATSALAQHLNDAGEYGIGINGSGSVSYNAAVALALIGPTEKEVVALIRQMQSATQPDQAQGNDNEVRYICAKMIGNIGERAKKAVPFLKKACEDDFLRPAAAASLLRINPDDHDARRIIFESSENHDSMVVVDTIHRMGWQDANALDVLRRKLKADERRVRIVAAGLLLKAEPENQPAKEAFRSGFGDDFDGIRLDYEDQSEEWLAVLCILKDIRGATHLALPIAIEALSNQYRNEGAREALVAMGSHRDLPYATLLERINSDQLDQKLHAMEAAGLLKIESDQVVTRLISTLKEKSPVLRACAITALGNIHKSDRVVIDSLTTCLEDDYATVRMNAAIAMAKCGSAARSAKPALLAIQLDASKPVRDAVARALVAIEKPTE